MIRGTISPMDDDAVYARLRRRASEMIDSICTQAGCDGLPTEKEVLMGEPYEVILKTAKEEGADLIVMGNRGFSKIKRFFVGSVTQRVISEAPCPVLVVHTNAEDEAD